MANRPRFSWAILAFVLLLFFLSGFAALLYQTIWQRMLGFFSGVDVYSVTITVTAFMGGLGCGSLAGGHMADRLSAKQRLLAFSLAEAVITLFALGSKWLYYDFLYLEWNNLANTPALLPLVLFASLLIPTFCMGMTLPILAKTFTAGIESASAIVGYLYAVNTLGASVGALLTPWILLRRFGFEDILRIGAGLNAICAVGAILLWWWVARAPDLPDEEASPESATSPETAGVFRVRTWLLIYALSGFIALALEIVWFRLLGVLQKSTAFTFPTLLAVYLGGLAIGVLVGVPLAKRVRRPALVFLGLQSGITLYAAGMLALFLHHVNRQEFLKPLWLYLGGYDPANASDMAGALFAWFSGGPLPPELWRNARTGLILYFGLPMLLITPSTLLMGASFPVLQKLVQDNRTLLGRRVGWLQTLNIAGSMVGALIVGWGLLHWLGSSGTMKLLVVLGGIFLVLAAWQLTQRTSMRVVSLIASVICVGWIAFLVPPSPKLWAKLHGTVPRGIVACEGASGLAAIKGEPSGFEKDVAWVFTNGLGQSWLPYGGPHTQIGLLAVALHPKPIDIAIIGIGSGDTVYALGASPHTREITAIEIVDRMQEALAEVAPRVRCRALDFLLTDPRVHRVFTDGRAYLLRSDKQFDVIEADALRANSAYSGNLYSWQYFQLLKSRLKPGGLAVTWVPTARVLASFLKVFPHAIFVDGFLIGSEQPLSANPEAIRARFADPFTAAHYSRLQTDVSPLLVNLLAGQFTRYSPDRQSSAVENFNSDLFPKDEYMVPAGQ